MNVILNFLIKSFTLYKYCNYDVVTEYNNPEYVKSAYIKNEVEKCTQSTIRQNLMWKRRMSTGFQNNLNYTINLVMFFAKCLKILPAFTSTCFCIGLVLTIGFVSVFLLMTLSSLAVSCSAKLSCKVCNKENVTLNRKKKTNEFYPLVQLAVSFTTS